MLLFTVKQSVTAGEQRPEDFHHRGASPDQRTGTGTCVYWEQVKLQDHPVMPSEVFLNIGCVRCWMLSGGSSTEIQNLNISL